MIINTLNYRNNISFRSLSWTEQDSQEFSQALKQKQVVFLDIDTQKGFLYKQGNPNGDFYIEGSGDIIPNLKKITKCIKDYFLPKIQTLHTSDGKFKKNSVNWQKISETTDKLRRNDYYLSLPVDNNKLNDVPADKEIKKFLDNGGTISIEKNRFNLFEYKEHRNGEEIIIRNRKSISLFKKLKKFKISIAVIYGVATDLCIEKTVKGLKNLGIRPIIVKDAVKEASVNLLDDPNSPIFSDVKTITTKELINCVSKRIHR